ncbi:MAG: hypothetical protein PHT28_03625 [Dehalococcoidales bacterium]|jgi:hypothetical protein|nr:hypothetical protein [Dehalococcoidales bacterium]MDD4230177.1 hypothetical protein [Dehalococcoidales bacterium]MDD4465669.1 hypothetical protein [Dehalococcoidales bacterium]MDD5401769.1 hypothetical protein [Dehalococcoidales bacterium]
MANREDEYYRQNYYGGHPPACTCVKCTEQRLADIKKSHSAGKCWHFLLTGVSITAAGWIVFMLLRGSMGTGIGMIFITAYLGVFIWAASVLKSPRSGFISGLLSLAIILSAIIGSIATW